MENAFFESLELANTINPIPGGNTVIFSYSRAQELSPRLWDWILDRVRVKWRWTPTSADSRFVGPNDFIYDYSGILAFPTNGPVYGIEIDKGELLWENLDFKDGRDYNSGFKEMVINGFEEPQAGKERKIHLGINNIYSGQGGIAVTIEVRNLSQYY
ncbi:MAG: hypothetical protein R3C61_17290 [Bacteroidia bacterium]